MTFDLSITFDIPNLSICNEDYLGFFCFVFFCLFFVHCHNVNVAFAFKICNHRALRCKQRNVAFAFKIRNHRALRCFLDLSENSKKIS